MHFGSNIYFTYIRLQHTSLSQRRDHRALSSFTHTSWGHTLRKAAQIRIYDQIESQWDLGPRGGYHTKCYQVYTNKEKLQRICIKRDRSQGGGETKQDTGEENPNKRVSRAMISSLKSDTCVICHNEKCSKENRCIQEPLIHSPTIGNSKKCSRD